MNTQLVEVQGKQLITTSLVIAELFERRHDNVLQSLDKISNKNNGLVFECGAYIDKNGDSRRLLILNERQFLIAMPFIGGRKSFDGQVRLVDEFIRIHALINDPDRKQAIQHKRDANRPMMDMLHFTREFENKDTKTHHYSNESLFCNRALTGKWEKLDESTLDTYDIRLLEAVRSHNTLLISKYPVQADRKKLLDKFVTEYRIKKPRLQLVQN